MKKAQVTLLVVLALATAATIGCSGASSAKKPTLPTYTQLPFVSDQTASPATDLFLMNMDGSSVTPIPFSSTDVWTPSANASLSTIAFVNEDNIWVSNASGSTQTQLSSDNDTYSVRVSPDGTKIVYNHYDNQSTWNLWVMNADGTSPLNLTSTITGNGVQCYVGSFSADSSQIVLMCWDENAGFSNLYTVNPDGTSLTEILTQSSYCSDWCDTPAFSPDGTQILFVSDNVPQSGARPHQPAVNRPIIHGKRNRPSPKTPSTGWGIVSIALDGSNPTVVNSTGAWELEVLNSTLYYTAYDSTTQEDQIFSANVDGSSPVMITNSDSAWSELGISTD